MVFISVPIIFQQRAFSNSTIVLSSLTVTLAGPLRHDKAIRNGRPLFQQSSPENRSYQGDPHHVGHGTVGPFPKFDSEHLLSYIVKSKSVDVTVRSRLGFAYWPSS